MSYSLHDLEKALEETFNWIDESGITLSKADGERVIDDEYKRLEGKIDPEKLG